MQNNSKQWQQNGGNCEDDRLSSSSTENQGVDSAALNGNKQFTRGMNFAEHR